MSWIVRVKPWFTRLAHVGASQFISQGVGFIAAILIARQLTVQGYGYYALAIAVLTAISVVGDSGIGSQLAAIVGRRWPDPTGLGGLYRQAMLYRFWLSAALCVVGVPGLAILMLTSGADWVATVVVCLLVVVSVFATLQVALQRSLLAVHYDFRVVANSGVVTSIPRLISAVLLVPFETAGPALPIAGNAVAAGAQSWWFARRIEKSVDLSSREVFPEDRIELRQALIRLLPSNLFLVAQGQGFSFLIAALGGMHALAVTTAVGRYGLIFALVTSLATTVLAPALSRRGVNRQRTARAYIRLVIAVAGLQFIICIGLIVSSPLTLGLLGPKYDSYFPEYVVITVGSMLSSIGFAAGGFALARGWTAGAWLTPTGITIWMVANLLLTPITTTMGAAVFLATASLPIVAGAVGRALIGIRGEREVDIALDEREVPGPDAGVGDT